VWFGEMPYHMDQISDVLSRTDIFVCIGTSGVVYPAAGFASSAAKHGARCIEVNLENTEISKRFNERRIGAASVEVTKLAEELLQSV